MYLIRDARRKDLTAILLLAKRLNSYNLPADRRLLRKLLRASEASFKSKKHRGDHGKFLFVLEDTKKRKIVGCSLILARHGSPRLPHLSFQLEVERKRSRALKKTLHHTTLRLNIDTQGYTEVGGLVVLPRYRRRKERLGKQLSFVRFAYMANFPMRFCRQLLVEYLPRIDPRRGNPFWKSLGKKFTKLPYFAADRLSARSKEFILSLFPKEKIYGTLLPESALRHLKHPGGGGAVSLRLLNKIGFCFLDQVDPFDGGPHYGARFRDVTLIRQTRLLKYQETPKPRVGRSPRSLVLVISPQGTRAMVTRCRRLRSTVFLPEETAQALGLKGGEKVSITPFEL